MTHVEDDFLKDRQSELTHLAGEEAARFLGCTVQIEPAEESRSWTVRVFRDGVPIAGIAFNRQEMLLSEAAKKQIIRERLRNVLRWI